MNSKAFSALETLPIELLEKIFFYSLNVNLPRVLPKLGAALSNERVYRLLILLAFWDNDYHYDHEYNPSKNGRVFGGNPARYGDLGTYTWRQNPLFDIFSILRPLGRDYVPLTSGERAALQSDILMCRWCTNNRIRRQLPDLARLIISRFCINAGYIFEDKDENLRLEKLLHYVQAKDTYEFVVVRLNRKRPEQHDEEMQEEDHYRRCILIVRMGEFVEFQFENRPEGVGPWFPILSILAIPPRLLDASVYAKNKGLVRGNFTDAHLSLLETLRFSGQLMLHVPSSAFRKISHSRDAIQQGIHIALSTFNLRALDILLKLDRFFYRDLEPWYTIPSGHFRTAAQLYIDTTKFHKRLSTYIDDPSIKKSQDAALLPFLFLLTSAAESVPHDDPVVRQFALVEGGAFGKWLLDMMAELPRHIESLVNGDCDVGDNGDFYFFARSPDDFTRMGARYHEDIVPQRDFFRLPSSWLSRESYDRYLGCELHL